MWDIHFKRWGNFKKGMNGFMICKHNKLCCLLTKQVPLLIWEWLLDLSYFPSYKIGIIYWSLWLQKICWNIVTVALFSITVTANNGKSFSTKNAMTAPLSLTFVWSNSLGYSCLRSQTVVNRSDKWHIFA